MSTVQERLGAVLERLATGTNVHRARAYDRSRALRNGEADAQARLEAVVVRLESAADALWGELRITEPPASERLQRVV
jgi:hypothetical protein